jgi:hypothetical protein
MLITLPSHLNFNTVLPIITQLNTYDFIFGDQKLEIDFGPLAYSKPSGALLLGIKLKEVIAECDFLSMKVFGLNIDNSKNAHSYLSHTGFFKFVGFEIGNAPGEARGSNTYVPIKNLVFDDIRNQVALPYWTYLDIIQGEALRLAQIFTFGASHYQRFLTYIFREIIRNSFEHSLSQNATFYGQYWPAGDVELVLFDPGVGIAKNIQKKFGAHLTTPEAIKMATKPGISGQDLTPDSVNSGFGLYILKELAFKYGKMTIISNKHGVTYESASPQQPIFFETDLPGTTILIHMKAENKSLDYEQIIKEIARKGEAEALAEGRLVKASISSSSYLR